MQRSSRLALKILFGNAITVVAAIVLYVAVNLALNEQEALRMAPLVTFAGLLTCIALASDFSILFQSLFAAISPTVGFLQKDFPQPDTDRRDLDQFIVFDVFQRRFE